MIGRTQNIPGVFREIIHAHDWMKNLGQGPVISIENVRRYRSIRKDLRTNLIPSAERALRWNTDKGATR